MGLFTIATNVHKSSLFTNRKCQSNSVPPRLCVSESILLSEQPQFADKCDWTKLSEDDWKELLECQPQLAAFRPTNQLSN